MTKSMREMREKSKMDQYEKVHSFKGSQFMFHSYLSRELFIELKCEFLNYEHGTLACHRFRYPAISVMSPELIQLHSLTGLFDWAYNRFAYELALISGRLAKVVICPGQIVLKAHTMGSL